MSLDWDDSPPLEIDDVETNTPESSNIHLQSWLESLPPEGRKRVKLTPSPTPLRLRQCDRQINPNEYLEENIELFKIANLPNESKKELRTIPMYRSLFIDVAEMLDLSLNKSRINVVGKLVRVHLTLVGEDNLPKLIDDCTHRFGLINLITRSALANFDRVVNAYHKAKSRKHFYADLKVVCDTFIKHASDIKIPDPILKELKLVAEHCKRLMMQNAKLAKQAKAADLKLSSRLAKGTHLLAANMKSLRNFIDKRADQFLAKLKVHYEKTDPSVLSWTNLEKVYFFLTAAIGMLASNMVLKTNMFYFDSVICTNGQRPQLVQDLRWSEVRVLSDQRMTKLIDLTPIAVFLILNNPADTQVRIIPGAEREKTNS
ncbi:hypothetical protein, partial [Flagellimonas marinaquae]